MPTGEVQAEEFRRFVLNDYGTEIADQFVEQLGTHGTTLRYSQAVLALDAVLARHPVESHSGPTTFRGNINLVI